MLLLLHQNKDVAWVDAVYKRQSTKTAKSGTKMDDSQYVLCYFIVGEF